jgi:hypothetical protein
VSPKKKKKEKRKNCLSEMTERHVPLAAATLSKLFVKRLKISPNFKKKKL